MTINDDQSDSTRLKIVPRLSRQTPAASPLFSSGGCIVKFETIDLDGLAVIAHVEHGEIWLFLDDLSKEFNLPVEDFLAWPKVEEFLFSLMFEHGLTDPAETQTYFDRLVRSTREPPYRGIWLSEPLALEFVGVCHPALRYRLQQWLACRFAAERQAPGRHLAEARHDKTFH